MLGKNNTEPSNSIGAPSGPDSFTLSASGFTTEEHALELLGLVGDYIRKFSCVFDLSRLDGVTVAYDYNQALQTLDRGYTTQYNLAPSTDNAIGVAMSPSVLRNGILKSHILFNACYLEALTDSSNEYFPQAIQIIAHECAHVEVTYKFDSTFPNTLLVQPFTDSLEATRWSVILACWDEYAVTKLSAKYGKDPTEDYEDIFLECLAKTRDTANECIQAFRVHGGHEQALSDICQTYSRLLKFSSYHLGNLDGLSISPWDRPRTNAALDGHWFAPFFERLHTCCLDVAFNYGKWENKEAFNALGDLLEDVLADGGLIFTRTKENQLRFNIL